MDSTVKKRNRELFATARERLVREKKSGLDVIYVTHKEDAGADRSFFFLTGIDRGSFLYASILVGKEGNAHLFIPELEEEEARLAGLPYSIVRPGEDTLARALRGHQQVGVNAGGLTLAEAGRLKDKRFHLVNIAQELEDARACKSAQELENLRKSCRIAAETARRIPGMARTGMTERELAARIDFTMARLGSERPAFDTIVAFGKNSAIPHAVPGGKKLLKGDLVLCDFGATFGKMCSDITRVYVCGKPSPEQSNLYHAVLDIQERALARLRVDEPARAIHLEAESAVTEFFRLAKAPGKMGHGLGHSIGFYSHDGKSLSKEGFRLPDNFAVTVEPAGYLPGFGGVRIEDTVFVTRKGVEILTARAPKNELLSIPQES
ncbi:MAG: Xaa-Pro peptidase family protein [Fibrobacterota bacterium]